MSQHLPVVSTLEAIRAFEKVGYAVLAGRGKGSHVVMAKSGVPAILTIPQRKAIRRGTLRALIRDAGLTVDEFRALL